MASHELTPEERSRGGRASAQKRRELGMSFRERLAKRLDEKADDVIAVFIDALEAELTGVTKEGDVFNLGPAHSTRMRAALNAIHEAFGRPTQEVEVSGPHGAPVEIEHRGVNLADVIAVAREAGMELGDRKP